MDKLILAPACQFILDPRNPFQGDAHASEMHPDSRELRFGTYV